MKTAQPNTDKK